MIKVIIADHQLLTREGLVKVLTASGEIDIVGYAETPEVLKQLIWQLKPQLVMMDYNYGRHFSPNDIQNIHANFDFVRILMLANKQQKNELMEAMDYGVKSHISKECSSEEILQAVHATAAGEQYFCKRTIEVLFGHTLPAKKINGQPLLSGRETEIVQLIAEGKANKEIADLLYLSVHTIKTHRKNIIKKLGFTFKHASELILLLSYLNDLLI